MFKALSFVVNFRSTAVITIMAFPP
jgi:hypothetical protein